MDVGRELDPPVRWVRARLDEPDLDGKPAADLDGSRMVFLYEFTAAGEVLRQIALMGDSLVPVEAASLAEIWEAQNYQQQAATPALLRYHDRFCGVAEGLEPEWLEYPHEEITAEEFERIWTSSRAHLMERPRSDHFAT